MAWGAPGRTAQGIFTAASFLPLTPQLRCPCSFVKGVDVFFLWQAIGGGLMTVAPALTYSLKARQGGARGTVSSAPPSIATTAPIVATGLACLRICSRQDTISSNPPTPTSPTHPLNPHTRKQKLADEGRLGEAWAKTMNAGVAAAAAGHLAGEG